MVIRSGITGQRQSDLPARVGAQIGFPGHPSLRIDEPLEQDSPANHDPETDAVAVRLFGCRAADCVREAQPDRRGVRERHVVRGQRTANGIPWRVHHDGITDITPVRRMDRQVHVGCGVASCPAERKLDCWRLRADRGRSVPPRAQQRERAAAGDDNRGVEIRHIGRVGEAGQDDADGVHVEASPALTALD